MRKMNAGIAMIEVLISMGMIAIVLLSLLSYQISMVNSIDQSRYKTIATIQLNNFSEMLLINTTHTRQQSALKQWNKDNACLLPQGRGDLTEIDAHQCKITVQWIFKKPYSESLLVVC